MRSAKSSTDTPSASMLRLTITPGCTGRNPGLLSVMIVHHLDTNCLAVFPTEYKAPLRPDLHRVLPGSVAFERMEGGAGLVHVLRVGRSVQHCQQFLEPTDGQGINAFGVV